MALSDRLTRLASGRQLPRRTVRLRLTLLYGGLFLACGAALLAITYVLVDHATVRPTSVRTSVRGVGVRAPGSHRFSVGRGVLSSVVRGQRISDLHQLVIWSGIALAGMALVSILLGWLVAGRVLRPLRTITDTTDQISASNLHRRLALDGPDDELKRLGDTIDALLTRLEGSFEAQRAFVANASHELRTPLTLSRATLQFALADPGLTLDALKAACADALGASQDHEQLLDALLTLAQSQQRIEQRETFDLATTAEAAIRDRRGQSNTRGITLHTALHAASISGDPRLVRLLVGNLLDNAVLHNNPGGQVELTTGSSARSSTLTVQNTGPQVPPDQIERLLQPFRRREADRTAQSPGHGLGLSIVAAIAVAHDAALEVQPNADGGLRVAVAFPASADGRHGGPSSVAAHEPALVQLGRTRPVS